ncbi:T9SS type A sorting domain-containing protein [Ferruginibacter albus]|uniref:T9SS type A sorting domain-containing protein n=1 Tax=Ferruginibacter albus TaxID=2875540 RepID=UPI001CC7E91B|nr:T9SS type A sorting domain-containing protein [Ferruginibacter albus]UAY52600.1 T9SS type A sorting domain-containing protein [Ferruginibacter albus]
MCKQKLATLTLLILISVIAIQSFAQSNYQHWEWAKSYGGSGNDSTVDIKIKNGYLYITGNFTSPTINWDGTTLTNNGGTDIFIAKMDTSGNTIWVKSFGGTGNDDVRQLEVNNSSTIALLCSSQSNLLTIGTSTLISPQNLYTEIDENGNIVNVRKLRDSLIYSDIDIDYSGNIYLGCSYSNAFTFGNTFISTAIPNTPPNGAPVIYIGNSYYYSDPLAIPTFTSGGAVLKYDMNGKEEWAKPLYAQPVNVNIEYDANDTAIVALFKHSGPVVLDSSYYYPQSNQSAFIAGISVTGNTKYAANFLSGGGKFGDVSIGRFEINNNGLGFIDASYYLSFESYSVTLSQFQYGKRINSISSGYPDQSAFNYDRISPFSPLNTLEPATDNNLILLNGYNGYINVLDAAFNRVDSLIPRVIVTPIANIANNLYTKCMSGKSIYFGDSFTGDSIVTSNNGLPNLPQYTLYNKGNYDVFISKYQRLGYMPLTFNNIVDSIKICDNSVLITFDSLQILKYYGAGGLTYHWQPAINFENANALSSKLFMNSDTLTTTLTITDKEGNSISKNFFYYKGIPSDLRLKLSDSAVCSGSFITVSLSGNLFDKCTVQSSCYSYPYSFDSLTQVQSVYTGSCTGLNYFKLTSASSKYCFDTTSVIVKMNPVYSQYQQIQVCYGNSYAIPGDSTVQNITSSYRHISYRTSIGGCDSTTIIDLIASSPPVYQAEYFTICAGNDYTFPDNFTLYNIQFDTSHKSIAKSFSGCDSIIITNLKVAASLHISQDTAVCAGIDLTFPDGSTAYNIQSNQTHISVIPNVHCYDSITTRVFVMQAPDTSVTKIKTMLQANAGIGTYQWIDCNTGNPISSAINQSYIALTAGNYAVQLQQNGCFDRSSCYTILPQDLLTNRPAANVYPIPAQNTFTISVESETAATLQVSLYNAFGKLVISDTKKLVTGVNEFKYNVSSLEKGMYVLKLFNVTTQTTTTQKILVNK